MATFASLAAADARAAAKVADGTWVEAFGALRTDGQPIVRFLRFMNITDVPFGTFDGQNTAGAWDESSSDTTV